MCLESPYTAPERIRKPVHCQYCSSRNVRWFTPQRYAAKAAVLLCMSCQRLTIVPPRASRAVQAPIQRAA